MIEKEKVIKGLETCAGTNNSGDDANLCELDCPYKGSSCIDRLMYDAIALLKEQEAVEARKKTNGIPQPWASWWYVCGDCGQEIDYHDRFCRWCGRAAKWE